MLTALTSRSSSASPGSSHRCRSNQPSAKSRWLCRRAPGPLRSIKDISWNPPFEFPSALARRSERADAIRKRIRRAAAEPEADASGCARWRCKRQKFHPRWPGKQMKRHSRLPRPDRRRRPRNTVGRDRTSAGVDHIRGWLIPPSFLRSNRFSRPPVAASAGGGWPRTRAKRREAGRAAIARSLA